MIVENRYTFQFSCTACGSNEHTEEIFAQGTHGRHVLDANESFAYRRCGSCGNYYLSSLPRSDMPIEKHYADDYYEGESSGMIATLSERRSFRKKFKFIMSLCNNSRGIKLLDVGCGSGEFLERLKDMGFDVAGIEPNKNGAEICRRKGLRVENCKLPSLLQNENKYDVVTLWHVFEHMPDPIEQLRITADLLSKDGVILIAVPNAESIGFRYGRKMWFHLDAPRHLFLPTIASMREIAKAAGFTVEHIFCDRFEYPLDLLWSVRKEALKYLVWPLYPFFKLASKETLTYALRPNNELQEHVK